MKAIWQLWESELSDDTINNIINECMLYTPEEAKTGQGKDSKKRDIRRSTVRWINPNDKGSMFIERILWHYATHANRNVFGVEIKNIFDIQYTIYEGTNEGYYDWHFDTFWGNDSTNDRKLSITIQLSDGDDYKGGDFLLDPQYEAPDPKALRKKGSIFVFPSVIRHKVEPVTSGTRKSLVAWVEGPKWK